MSYTELYIVPKEGSLRPFTEFQNAYGGAWFVWNAMYEAYEKRPGEFMHQDSVLKRVWDLWKDERTEFFEKAVMGSTFDRVMVRREHWPLLAECMEMFYKKHYDPAKGVVCSIGTQARVLKELFEKAPEDIVAVCWNQTSVNGGYWYVPNENAPDDDDEESEEENERGYDISKDKKDHWFLFDELEIPE